MHVALDGLVPRRGVYVAGQAVEALGDDAVAFGKRADSAAGWKTDRPARMDCVNAVRDLPKDPVPINGNVENEVRLIAIRIAVDGNEQTAFLTLVRAADRE